MSRRIDIELTSARPDGTWTWRAAGAREPKGVLDGTLLPGGVTAGAVLKADAEFGLDGTTILSVSSTKEKTGKSNLLEILPSDKPFEAVTSQLAGRGDRGDRGGSRDRRDRPPRRNDGDGPNRGPRPDRGPRTDGDAPRRDRPAGAADRGPRTADRGPQGDRSARPGGGPRPERTDRPARRGPRFAAPPELPQRPKAKRLKPGRAHRSAVLADLPEEQRAVAERALQGGLPAVRQAVNEQNARLKSEGKPEIPAAGLLSMAEQLLPKLRVAEWLDRADAALHDLEELDLRDLRSVVAAAEDPTVARDESTRQVAAQLKEALASKQDKELSLWFADIEAAIGVGRIVRALKLSSQPPKAGVRFPAELAGKLAATTTSSLSVDALPDRWVAVLEAAAFSPIRSHVQPTDKPAQINDELLATVKRVGSLLPHIATLFGVEVVAGGQSPKPLRPARPAPAKKAAAKAPIPPPPASTPAADTPAADAAVADTPAAEVPATDASVTNEAPTGSGPGHAEAVEPTDPNATVHEPVLVSTDADVATEADEPPAEADTGSNTDAEPATVYPPVEASLDEADTGAIVDAADHASDEANAAIVEPAEQIDADATVHEPVVVSTDADVLTESEQAEQWPEDGDATEHVPAIVSLDADPAQDDTAEIDTSSLEVDDRTANEADAATAELVDLDAFTPDD